MRSALVSLVGRVEPRDDAKRRRSGFSASTHRLVEELLGSVAARHGLAPDAVRRARTPQATQARYEWIVLLQDSWALTASDTGRLCGVDHGTVLLAQKRRQESRGSQR